MLGRALLGVVIATVVARADEFANSPTRPGYEPSDHVFDFDRRTELDKKGVTVGLTYSVDLFAAPQLEKRLVAGGMFMTDLDIDLATLAKAWLGALHVSTATTHGGSPTDELGDVHGASGNTAPYGTRLFEAWYEQPFGPITVRAGILAVDQEYNYADPTTTLLGATFGITAQYGFNVGGPLYPVGTPGVSARYDEGKMLLQIAVYDGTSENNRGIPTGLGPATLVLAEATWDRDIGMGAWRHGEKGSGVYGTFDHQLDELVEAFFRIGLSGQGITAYFDAGVRIGPGPLSFRPDDFFSVGMAFAQVETGDQILVEGTYEAQWKWLTIQPAVQMVMMRERTIGILATRFTVAF
jgi:hypothetical protein